MYHLRLKFMSLVLAGILLPQASQAAQWTTDIVDIPVDEFIKSEDNASAYQFASNEVIVTLKEGMKIPKSTLDTMLKMYGEYTSNEYEHLDALFIHSAQASTQKLVEILESEIFKSYVESVSFNTIYKLEKSNDTYYDKLWAVENNGQEVHNTSGTVDADMDVVEAWEKTKGDSDVVVAVLDTGVDYTHSDLTDNMWQGNANHGYDFAGDDNGNNDNNPTPDEPYNEKGHYHGTHVAGIIGATGDNSTGISGVAQQVSIMAVKVFRPNGAGYSNDILEGLDYVLDQIDNGVNIVAVNASYGGGGSQNDSMNRAIKKLGEKGVVFCAAAGNDGKNIDNDPVYPASYDADNIIAIAASDQDDALASFSNYGVNTVDVAAPGTNILSTYPEDKYAYLNGTSMATPQVAGSIALLAAKYPESTVAERKDMILSHVDKKGAFSNKVATGGRVNINEALGEEEEQPNTAPEAKNDSATTAYETVKVIDVLANDSDIDGDNLSIKSYTTPSHGTVTKENGKLKYTPESGFSGTDTFNYTITNGALEDMATVTVTVNEKSGEDKDTTWYQMPNPFSFMGLDNFFSNGMHLQTEENDTYPFIGIFTKEGMQTVVRSMIDKTVALVVDNKFTVIGLDEGNMQIKVDAEGRVTPHMPNTDTAVVPKTPFPLGTEVDVRDSDEVKFVVTMTENIKF